MDAKGGWRLKMAGNRLGAVQGLVLLYRARACEAEVCVAWLGS